MTIVDLSDAEIHELRTASDDPAVAKLDEITVEHATEKGGQTLAYYRLCLGYLFGNPWMMTTDDVAKRMGIPVSTVARIAHEADAEIDRRWRQMPEYKESRYAAMHRARREGRPPSSALSIDD